MANYGLLAFCQLLAVYYFFGWQNKHLIKGFYQMKIFNIISLCVLFCFSSAVQAKQCNQGKVTSVAGNATVERNSQVIALEEGLLVCTGDIYVTDAASVVQLKLRDGSAITIGKESEFKIIEYKIYKNKPNIALFELAKGAFRVVTGYMVKKPHRYEVKTVDATIGVRGTDFWGGFGLTENGLDVIMLSGKGVYVTNNNAETVELDADGFGTTIIAGAAPSLPKKWGDAKVAKAVATITP